MEPELVEYLIRAHQERLPILEPPALAQALCSQKLDAAANGALWAQANAMMLRLGLLPDGDDILILLNEGVAAFRERLAQRICDEHDGEALLNSCPNCQRLARTSRAKQCRYCGHDWH